MVIEYRTFTNGEEIHFVKINDIDEDIDTNTPEGTQYLNRKVSEATGLPVGSFKVMSAR